VTVRVTFYDVAAEARFQLATKLAQAAWDKAKRLVIRCRDEADARALDDHLWVFREDGFVPHEVSDGQRALMDPEARVVLVAADVWPPGLAIGEGDILVQLAPADAAYATAFGVVIDWVDHSDEARLSASRARYKTWVDRGLKPEMKDKV
jgi:DNA polymerase-3 subunit chi